MQKHLSLAPIAVEILLCRGSAQKIVTESGMIFSRMPNVCAPNINDCIKPTKENK